MPSFRLTQTLLALPLIGGLMMPGQLLLAATDGPGLDELLIQGQSEVARFRWSEAAPLFAQAKGLAPAASDAWFKAAYAHAECLHQQVPSSQALVEAAAAGHAAIYEAGLATHRREAGFSAIQLGRIAHLVDYFQDPVDLAKAREWYGKAIAGWTDDTLATQATLYLAQSFTQELTPEGFAQAERLLRERLASHPADPLVGAAWFQLADVRQTYLRDWRGTVEALAQAERFGGPASARWRMVWRMGMIAKDELDDRDLAIRCFRRIISEFPTSGRSTLAQEHLRSLGVEPPAISDRIFATADAATDPPGAASATGSATTSPAGAAP